MCYWRKMRKPFLFVAVVIFIVLVQVIISAPVRKTIRVQLNNDYMKAMGAYKRLSSRLPREELRVITAIGVLNGARYAEQLMEHNLVEIVRELLLGADGLNDDELVSKVQNIEKQLSRDHRALMILTSAMDLVTGAKNVYDFKADMQQTLQQVRRQSYGGADEDISQEITERPVEGGEESNVSERVAALRRQIEQQVRAMKSLVEEKVTQTLDYLISNADQGSLLDQASKKIVRKRNAPDAREVPAEVRMIKSILDEGSFLQSQEDFRKNLVDAHLEMRNNELIEDSEEDFEIPLNTNKSKIVIENRSNKIMKNTPTITTTFATTTPTTTVRTARATQSHSTREAVSTPTTITTTTTTLSPNPINSSSTAFIDVDVPKFAKQEEGEILVPLPLPPPIANLDSDDDFPDAPPPPDAGGGGGLVGIITSLSGGEGGSDIGALIGALTGVISTLFGPGGLDIESLISTATSLISGLLAGNKNFGTVLGIYIGTAFDGLSGGGGAVNNGQFFGNLLGTVYAQLSADPEDDDFRPNPLLFAKNLISSFVEAKNRKESDEEGDDERRSDSRHSHGNKGKADAGVGGSDSGGFIKHIASHVVGSLVNLVLNAALGASGGASHASASLFGSSSHKGGGGGAGGGGHKH